jgi:hypothetical protein
MQPLGLSVGRATVLSCFMSSILRLLHGWAIALLVVDVLALLMVDVAFWTGTRWLRPRADEEHSSSSTSRGPPQVPTTARASATTFLAASAGLTLLVIALTPPRAPWWPSVALAVVGLFVAVAGVAGRVRGFEVRQGAIVVRYAAPRAWAVSWHDCRELRPPRLPMGGWRVATTDGGRRTLMRSDLLGNEWVLAAIVQRAELSFTGRAWVREAPRPVSRPG